MAEYVTDTMALVLHLESRRMGSEARTAFSAAERGEKASIYVPAMVVAEILYLSERGRIEATIEDVSNLLPRPGEIARDGRFGLAPLDLWVLEAAARIKDIPEFHDRLIAATAVVRDVPLITNDPVIRASAFVRTVW